MLTPRQSVEAALLGRLADEVPFTMDFNEFHLCTVERELRNAGMCTVEQRVPIFLERNAHVSEKTICYTGEDGFLRQKKIYSTPKGVLSALYIVLPDHVRIPGELMPWNEEYVFKGPEDYAPIEAMIRGRQYIPCYDAFQRAEHDAGEDVTFRVHVGYSPFMEIIYAIMGLEQFAVEWHDRRDEVLHLYDVLTADKRKMYPVAAEAPVLTILYCANAMHEVLGVERFEKYVRPHLDEFGEMLHVCGKLLGVHYDGNTKGLAPSLANSQVDVMDSLTTQPNGDITVAEARAAWPNKVLWLNFPGWAYTQDVSVVEETTRQILRQAGGGERVIIGMCENVPKDRWQISAQAIQRVLKKEGRLPLR